MTTKTFFYWHNAMKLAYVYKLVYWWWLQCFHNIDFFCKTQWDFGLMSKDIN